MTVRASRRGPSFGAMLPDRRAAFDALVPDLVKGLRAAVVTLGPFWLAAHLDRPELSWTALGGWLGTLADPGGVRGARARATVAFAALGVVLVPVGELAGRTTVTATLVLAGVALVASLFRVFGAVATSLGTMSVIVTCIATARVRQEPAASPLVDGAAFATGALFAVLLSSIVWPVWPHLPVRRAVATVFEAVAAYAEAVDQAVAEGRPPGDGHWSLLAREHPRRVREAIEAARVLATAVRARRPGESQVGSNLRVLLGLAESELLVLVTLANELEASAPEERPRAPGRGLAAVATASRVVARRLSARTIRHEEERAAPSPASTEEPTPLRALGARLASLRDEALALSAALDARLSATAQAASEARGEPAASRWTTVTARARALRDTFTPRSPYFRHAARVVAAATTAGLLGQRVSEHPHWVTLTTLAVLQPHPSATFTRAAERVAGTVAGSVLAAGLMLGVHDAGWLGLALVPLSVAAVATRPRSYRLFTFFLTPVFVILADRHAGDVLVAVARSRDAALGGAVALVFALVTFPAWERKRLPDVLGGTLDAVGAYTAAVLGSLASAEARLARSADVVAARRRCATSLGEAEASLERLLAEPFAKLRSGGAAVDAVTVLTYARRLAGATTALDVLSDVGIAERAPNETIDGVAAYVRGATVNARRWVRERARVVEGTEPVLPDDVPVRVRAALGRVVRYAALLDALASPAPLTP